MTKARILADLISDNAELADGTISVAEVVGAAPLASPTFTGGIDITGGFTATDGSTITTADNTTQLSLISTDADANTGPVFVLWRNSASSADGDNTGKIAFQGEDDGGNKTTYSTIDTFISDNTNGTEDGQLSLKTIVAGTERHRINMKSAETVINDDSVDLDFRVESDTNTHALFVDGGNNKIGMFTSNPADYYADTVVITTADEGGITLVTGTGHANYLAFADGTSGDAAYKGYVYYDHDTDKLLLGAAGATKAVFTASEVIINDNSVDLDFRVESDTNTHMLFVDAGANKVGVGITPTETLHVNGRSRLNNLYVGEIYASLDLIQATSSNGLYLIGGASNLTLGVTESVFNTNGANVDFRVESDTNTHMLFVDASTDRVGIGAGASPATTLHVADTTEDPYVLVDGSGGNRDSGYKINAGGGVKTAIRGSAGGSLFYGNDNNMILHTDGAVFNSDRAAALDFRVASGGNNHAIFVDAGLNQVIFGKSSAAPTTNGLYLAGVDPSAGVHFHAFFTHTNTVSGNSILYVNRQSSDGTLIDFRHANATEGSISVSSATVSYNGFSGRHESSGIPANTPIGTVVSTIDALDVYPATQNNPEGVVEPNPKAGQTRADHAQVEVSTSTGDSCVYGVVSEFDSNGKLIVTSVGIGSVRVTGACVKGDLLESNGDGTAKAQSDDIVRSKTLGKVTIGNSDTGVKLVSCVMYCG